MPPRTQISRKTKRALGILFTVTALVLLVANTLLGNELIRALPGIMSNTDFGMPVYLSIMLMVGVSLLELMVFSGIIDIEDGVQGAIEHIVLWAIRIVLPFDVLGNVFGIIIGNAPISQATERVSANLTRFIVIFASIEGSMPFSQKVEIIGDGFINVLIVLAVLALAVLVGAGPEFFLGKYLKSQYPDFVHEMRLALHVSGVPATNAPAASVPTTRPVTNQQPVEGTSPGVPQRPGIRRVEPDQVQVHGRPPMPGSTHPVPGNRPQTTTRRGDG